ncbi:hypothetical protein RUM44_006136 [Polyplax serrata]|uniref:Uncharacterized protein n=1 Tax=Polyplax serrata TaxID=468196 RepID=A0ABR1B0N4_POLSC
MNPLSRRRRRRRIIQNDLLSPIPRANIHLRVGYKSNKKTFPNDSKNIALNEQEFHTGTRQLKEAMEEKGKEEQTRADSMGIASRGPFDADVLGKGDGNGGTGDGSFRQRPQQKPHK